VVLLAVPFLLAAAWLSDQVQLDPSNLDTGRMALLPAALGFGLLMAVFPFGTWMPALSADAPPIATAFIFTAGQAMTSYLALTFFQDAPWVLANPATSTVILLAGLIMAFSGGLLAAAQRDFGRHLGYAALSDLGVLLLAFSIGGSQGLTLALLHLISRSVSIALMGMSLAVLRSQGGSDRFTRLSGTARRLPVATFGLMLGGLALAGFPLTAGFATRWGTSRAILNLTQPLAAAVQEGAALSLDLARGEPWMWPLALAGLLASSLGIVIGLLRGLSGMLGSSTEQTANIRQPVVASFMILAVSGLAVLLAMHPQLFLDAVLATVEAFGLY
jgi:formate hydrogenlyase subunit 3/multisubunit Na+/H+ antiporter MnhD subunit